MTLSRTVLRILSALAFLVGLGISIVASLVAAYQTVKVVPHPGVLGVLALLAFFFCILLTTKLAGWLHKSFFNRGAFLTSAALTILYSLGLYFAVFRPMHYPHFVPVARANTRYWNLPTGSHIAYSVYEPPPGVPVKVDPIVFVHGGPGLRALDTDHAFYRQFVQDGFRVYLYDQTGSGLSGRLPHATDYTVERQVADLEAIRQQIAAERLVLIGHSWGGTLIAHYAVAHPEHVAKLIFHSPGPIWNLGASPSERQRTDAKEKGLPPPRIIAALALSYANVKSTEYLVPQEEFGDWYLATADPGQLVCKGERSKLPAGFSGATLAGLNMYPLMVASDELKKPEMDIRARLGKLHVPAIALESQCEFIPWSRALEYKKSIPGLQEFYFPDSGHYINFSQPTMLAAVIRSFLLDLPSPFPAYQDDQDPRPPIKP